MRFSIVLLSNGIASCQNPHYNPIFHGKTNLMIHNHHGNSMHRCAIKVLVSDSNCAVALKLYYHFINHFILLPLFLCRWCGSHSNYRCFISAQYTPAVLLWRGGLPRLTLPASALGNPARPVQSPQITGWISGV